MNAGRGKGNKAMPSVGISRPGANQMKKWMTLVLIMVITVGCIYYVSLIGKKAEETISVVMLGKNVYKNGQIRDDGETLIKYDMLVAEYEKYAIQEDNGTTKRRIVLWDEREKITGTFAAYPLQANTVAMYRDFVKSRVDNSDAVMYSFPGKTLVKLQISGSELDAFKTFLQPGDVLNIKASYVEKIQKEEVDAYGTPQKIQYEVQKTDEVFTNIAIADLLNANGQSVLDLYQEYNELTVWQQSNLDKNASYQETLIPNTLLVAFTPEESERYNYYLTKSNIAFRVELPQRVDR